MSETGCHERRRAYYIAHFLHINKDDLDKKHERPYNRENTASRSICEVKHVLVWIVVRWGTTREVQMLFFFNFIPALFSFSFFLFLSYACTYSIIQLEALHWESSRIEKSASQS